MAFFIQDHEAWKKEGFCKKHKGVAIGKVNVQGEEAFKMLEVGVELMKGVGWLWKEGGYKEGMMKMILQLLIR